MSEENWYVAVLVLECSVKSSSPSAPLVDLQYRLVQASNPDLALREAVRLGESAAHCYRNAEGADVHWTFAGLHDLRRVSDAPLANGSEVYSSIQHAAAADYVVDRDRLTDFWIESQMHKAARQILDEE